MQPKVRIRSQTAKGNGNLFIPFSVVEAMRISFLVLLLGAPSLAAQAADSVLAPLVPKTSLVRLRTEGTRVTGRLIALTSGVATLETESGNRTAGLASVDSIWVRGRATGTGAIVGTVAGTVLLGVFGAVIADAFCEEADCSGAWAEGALAGGVMGAAAGALLGAGIGALIPKWRLRFP
jgi:hypothetical protein